jgi:site-specific recombinase XerD
MTYREEEYNQLDAKLEKILKRLPSFCKDFLVGKKHTTTIKTRVAYALDLVKFFNYIENEVHKHITTVTELESITPVDISNYLEYITEYTLDGKDEKVIKNKNAGLKRKLLTIRSLYSYFFRMEIIRKKPASLVETPKVERKREIIRLEDEEREKFLDVVETGRNNKFENATKNRDIAIISIALGTGVRVDEIRGLNISDIEFIDNEEDIGGTLQITGKGGVERKLYFGRDVGDNLKAYMEERQMITAKAGNEDALFLSIQKTRINAKSIWRMVKKYGKQASKKNITPHKLRKTFGTNLYVETGDIYLVADTLGHKNVNTTKDFYASVTDEKKKQAGSVVKLRSQKTNNRIVL